MDTDLLKAFVAGQVRHLITLAAGYLVAKGIVQSGDSANFVNIASGAALALIAMGWSWWQKVGQEQVSSALRKLTARQTTEGAVKVAKVLPPASAVTPGLPVKPPPPNV